MLRTMSVVVLALAAVAGSALAQSRPGGERFCSQYAATTADVAGEAIKQNPGCLDFSRGVHANYQMHYAWCMRTPRSEVEGAGEHIRRLASRCTGAPAPRQGAGILGRVWHETEGGWRGIWTRVGTSNRFSAVWTHPSGGVVRADLTMTVSGNDVTIIRRDTFGSQVGKGCRYAGTIRGHQVSGAYDCDWGRGRHSWSAQISSEERSGAATQDPPVRPSAQKSSCPRGERPLPQTGLCPGEAIEAFLQGSVIRAAQLFPGCSYGVNETAMAGDVLLYGALKCGNWIGKLDYAGGAQGARLTARNRDGSPDIEITVLPADPSDPRATINRFARNAITDPKMRRECSAQDHPGGGGAIIFDLGPKAAALRDGPSGGECGPYGESNGPNHWRSFGGHVWYFPISDSEHTVDPQHMILLERDRRGDGLKGWRVRY